MGHLKWAQYFNTNGTWSYEYRGSPDLVNFDFRLCGLMCDSSDLWVSSLTMVVAIGRWSIRPLSGFSDGATRTATRFRLTPIHVVVVRWSMNLFIFIFYYFITTMDHYRHICGYFLKTKTINSQPMDWWMHHQPATSNFFPRARTVLSHINIWTMCLWMHLVHL
jgi:hypothetical protein